MKKIKLLLLSLLLAHGGMAQSPVKVDSIAQQVSELKQQNIEIRRELAETKREVAQYHDMFKQQWSFFWGSTVFLGLLIAILGYFSYANFYRKVHKAASDVEKLDNALKGLNDDIFDLSVGYKTLECKITLRIYNLSRHLEYLKTDYDGWFPIMRVSEHILSNYLAYKANPENERILNDLPNSIGQTYNAIEKIKSNVKKFNSPENPFTGNEFGITDLQQTLNLIANGEQGEIKRFAVNASEKLNQTIYSLIADSAKKRE